MNLALCVLHTEPYSFHVPFQPPRQLPGTYFTGKSETHGISEGNLFLWKNFEQIYNSFSSLIRCTFWVFTVKLLISMREEYKSWLAVWPFSVEVPACGDLRTGRNSSRGEGEEGVQVAITPRGKAQKSSLVCSRYGLLLKWWLWGTGGVYRVIGTSGQTGITACALPDQARVCSRHSTSRQRAAFPEAKCRQN